jgi:polyhydroxyalkanoate synthase
MRMCDESAFQLGRNLAITRGAVIHENPLIQLIQYEVRTSQVYATPLLIVPPFINKYYILDLRPENSFVRYALDQGFQVFILSWRNIPPELGHLTWNDYVTMGVEESIEIVQQITSARHIHTLGFCVGGTLLASALASTVPAEKIASLTLLASLLDFQEVGEIGVYIDEHFVRRSEERYAQGGVVAGAQLAAAFASLRARELIWKFVVENYLKGNTPPPFDLLYWNSDSANLPGRLYIWYLRHLYLNNSMRTPNTLRIKEQFVDLSRLRMPAFVLGTEQDHIVPWRAAYSSAQLLRGRVEFVLGASGHIAGVVSPPGGAKRHFRTSTASIDSRADEWLEKSTLQTGSWWPHWRNWLALHDEKKKRSRKTLGHGKFKAIEPAPGSYVRAGGISSI